MEAPKPLLPFEDPRLGLRRRVWLTFRAAFRTPLGGYEALVRRKDLASPWRLKLLATSPWYLGAALGLGALEVILAMTALVHQGAQPPGLLLVLPGLLGAVLVLGPVLQFANMVVGGLVLHGLLWAFRGTRDGAGLRQTLRAAGYTQAVVSLLCLAPPLALVGYPASRVVLGHGLSRLHRTEPWKGLAAAWLQGLLTLVALAALLGALAYGVARQDQKSRQILEPAPEALPVPREPPSEVI